MLHWLEIIRPEVKPTTFSGYRSNVKKVMDPYFRKKGVSLKDLTADDILEFYAERLRYVKAATVHRYHANIHQALKYAVAKNMIGHSVMEKVRRPKKKPFVGKFLKQSEAVELFESVRGHKLELGVILGAFYGLRRGEVVGLKWSAIDFEANTVTVEQP
jgi:integrase